MSDSKPDPYLSIVATSRNDNHGGDLLERMQVFINNVAELSRRFHVPTELLLVEWNPPDNRPCLAEALQWPESDGFCTYRIVEVPPELHSQLDTSDSLTLYQMIAKNVGIRRASAPFVLATNVDLLFSEELFEWLQRRPLRKRHFYRIDRYDVETDVINVNGVDEQLQFCRENLLRVNCRFGTFPLNNIESQTEGSQLSLNAMVRAEIKRRMMAKLKVIPKSVARRAVNLLLDCSVRNIIRFAKQQGRGVLQFVEQLKSVSVPKHGQSRTVARVHRWGRRLTSRNCLKYFAAASHQLIPYFRKHTNACGDFTLMAKSDWGRLRGYAEFEMYSWHIDSLFIHVADYAGIIEEVVPHPVYHIEHTGGWSPDSAMQLFERLKSRGIPCFTDSDLVGYEWEMARTKGAFLLNEEHWGLSGIQLPDYRVEPTRPTGNINDANVELNAAA